MGGWLLVAGYGGLREMVTEIEWANYEAWIEQVPDCVQRDPLWEFETYRKALFLSDLAWLDCEKLRPHQLGRNLIGQLLRSSSSVSANIEEGYGRGFGKDYSRFLRIALGSAREARGWYYRNRQALDQEVVEHRMNLLTLLIKNLTITAEQQRHR